MDAKKFNAIVLSGGGSSGILTLGALHYFYEIGRCDPDLIKEYAGASIGSAICLLLVCGYSPMDIFKEIFSADNFFDLKSINILQNIKQMGMISIDKFIQKIKELVLKKIGEVPTLKRLYEITKKRLCISATDITHSKEIKYSYEFYPNISCIEVVKQSCNIPLVFHSIKYENKYIVDGGVSNNYPWDYIKNIDCVLGIIICGNGRTFKEDNFLGYSHKVIMTPIKILSELRCNLAPSTIKTIKLFPGSSSSYLNISSNNSSKMDAFLLGYQQAKEQNSMALLNILGWDDSEMDDREWEDVDWDSGEWEDF